MSYFISEYKMPNGKMGSERFKSKANAVNKVCIACDRYFGGDCFYGVVYEIDEKKHTRKLVFEFEEKR